MGVLKKRGVHEFVDDFNCRSLIHVGMAFLGHCTHHFGRTRQGFSRHGVTDTARSVLDTADINAKQLVIATEKAHAMLI